MATDKLTEIAVKKAKPGERPIRMFDGGGMYLEVQPSGSKWWRHKFRFGGKEKLLSLGVYPEIGLANARKQRNEARELLARGIDPSIVRQAQKTARTQPVADSFEAVAREWHVKKQSGWSADHTTRTLRRMDDNVFPFIGAQHINSVTAPMLLAVIRRVESRGAIETAHTIMQQCGQVFRYGIATGRCERNPAPDLRDALKPVIVTHMAAETDPKRVGGLMRSIADYAGHPVTRAALAFSALVFQRPGNVRPAEWSEVDLEAAMWTVPSGKIKRTVQGKLSGPNAERMAALGGWGPPSPAHLMRFVIHSPRACSRLAATCETIQELLEARTVARVPAEDAYLSGENEVGVKNELSIFATTGPEPSLAVRT